MGMCTTVETGQTMTASMKTVRAPDSRLGGPINGHHEPERRAKSKESLGKFGGGSYTRSDGGVGIS